tara:strand:+ start:341 stop:1234 length:894 start_codon:yes stop_codon:yes gene_type:complete
MLYKRAILSLAAAGVFLSSCSSSSEPKQEQTSEQKNQAVEQPKNIVSFNGTLTETLFALGVGNQIVGTDVTSVYPPEANQIPKLGHVSKIQTEGVLSLNPDEVIMLDHEAKKDLTDQLTSTGVEVETVHLDYSIDGAKNLIQELGKRTNSEEKANELVNHIDESLKQVEPLQYPTKALFIYARGAGTMLVAGEKTQLDAMIHLAGGENAAKGFENFKPLTPESLVAANPDVIIFFDSGYNSLLNEEGVLDIPGMDQTNAGKNKNFITMEGQYLAGFGPRVGDAVVELNQKFAALNHE